MLYHVQSGSGRTIIFIHGNSQSIHIWDGLIHEPALTGYTLRRLDLPGHGHSPWSVNAENDYTLKGVSDYLRDFMLSNFNEEYIIVASSLATNIIAEIITQLPQCKGLFLVGPCVIGPGFSVSDIVQPNPHFGVTFTPDPTDEELEGMIGTWGVQLEASLKKKCMQMFRDTDPQLRAQMGKCIALGEWGDETTNLEQLTYPVAVIYGEDEKIIFTDYLSRSAIRMWRDGIIKIPHAGHCCQLDKPAELAVLIGQYAADIFK